MKKLSLLVLTLVIALAAAVDPRPARADDLGPTEYFSSGIDDGSGGSKPCGFGNLVECGSVTTDTCVEWQTQTSTTFGPAGVTYSVTYVCAKRIVTTIKKYKD